MMADEKERPKKRGRQPGQYSTQAYTMLKELSPKDRDDLPIPLRFVGTTQALFFETIKTSTIEGVNAPYTLKRFDHEHEGVDYKSMYQMYIKCTSEYEAAIKILGSWEHWTRLLAAPFFRKHIDAWREELLLRDIAMAKKVLYEEAEGGNVQAARTLLAEGKEMEKRLGVAQKKHIGKRKLDDSDLANDKVVAFMGRQGN